MLKHTENIPSFEIFEAHFWILVGIKFITARKRSLGQGNAFTCVCHFVHGGVSVWGVSVQEGICPGGYLSRGSLSGGALCLGGVSVQGGLCQGDPLDRPPYGKERAVRILLECILVTSSIRTLRQSFRVNTYI